MKTKEKSEIKVVKKCHLKAAERMIKDAREKAKYSKAAARSKKQINKMRLCSTMKISEPIASNLKPESEIVVLLNEMRTSILSHDWLAALEYLKLMFSVSQEKYPLLENATFIAIFNEFHDNLSILNDFILLMLPSVKNKTSVDKLKDLLSFTRKQGVDEFSSFDESD